MCYVCQAADTLRGCRLLGVASILLRKPLFNEENGIGGAHKGAKYRNVAYDYMHVSL